MRKTLEKACPPHSFNVVLCLLKSIGSIAPYGPRSTEPTPPEKQHGPDGDLSSSDNVFSRRIFTFLRLQMALFNLFNLYKIKYTSTLNHLLSLVVEVT